jgi:lipopolysaccharide export system protein LptC
MAGDGGLHSRVVGWLKVLLPLVALAILSTLFFISDRIDPNAALPASGLDIEDRLLQPRMTAPAYSGVTRDGAALTLRAAEARTGQGETPGSGSATALTGEMLLSDGTRASLMADLAEINSDAGQVFLNGNVVAETSTGFRIGSATMQAAMDRTHLESPGPVTATGPIGQIYAGHMVLTAEVGKKGSYVLVFNEGVKLIYRPGSRRE